MGRYSRIYKVGSRRFRYDYKWNELQWVGKLTDEMKKENDEWEEKYGKGHLLYEVTEDGYVLGDQIGCSLDDWKESPRGVCEMWSAMIDEELSWL